MLYIILFEFKLCICYMSYSLKSFMNSCHSIDRHFTAKNRLPLDTELDTNFLNELPETPPKSNSKSSNSKFVNKSSRLSTPNTKSPRPSSSSSGAPKPPPSYESFGYGVLYDKDDHHKSPNPMADLDQRSKYPAVRQYDDSEIAYSPEANKGVENDLQAAPETADR